MKQHGIRSLVKKKKLLPYFLLPSESREAIKTVVHSQAHPGSDLKRASGNYLYQSASCVNPSFSPLFWKWTSVLLCVLLYSQAAITARSATCSAGGSFSGR